MYRGEYDDYDDYEPDDSAFQEFARDSFDDETVTWEIMELPETEYIHEFLEDIKNDVGLPIEMYLIVELTIIDEFCESECSIYDEFYDHIDALKGELCDAKYLSEAKEIMLRICKTLDDGYANFEEYIETSDIRSEYQDGLDFVRDPYAYYGLSRSDFI